MEEILTKYNQEHLIEFLKNLEEEKKSKIIKQINKIDFKEFQKIVKEAKKDKRFNEDKIEPISYIEKEDLSSEEKSKYKSIGENIIKEGKYAVVTMAGGQGTRLGHSGPKGTYYIENGINKYIFEILLEYLKEQSKKFGVIIPWYIMTSEENNGQTIHFFEEHNFFDYPKESIKFFVQGKLPMCDKNGRILIGEDGMLKEAADGHGGVFTALEKNNMLKDMKKKGIEWIFVCGVDNILSKSVDEILLGIAIEKKVDAAGKSLVKAYPEEKVGVFCNKNGRPSVIEYSEISDELAKARDRDGNLMFGESHILCNLFSLRAIEEISNAKLPYHCAFKKMNYLNEKGELIEAKEPNAYKFESFIFDGFEYLKKMVVMRVKREEEFAPIKNAEGNDSVETAVKLYKNAQNNY